MYRYILRDTESGGGAIAFFKTGVLDEQIVQNTWAIEFGIFYYFRGKEKNIRSIEGENIYFFLVFPIYLGQKSRALTPIENDDLFF